MSELEKRVEQVAKARQRLTVERIAVRLSEHFPEVDLHAGHGEVRIRGHGLTKRWLSEAQLRFMAEFMR